MASFSVLLVCALAVTSVLGRTIQSNDETNFPMVFGNTPSVYEDYHNAGHGNAHEFWTSTAGTGAQTVTGTVSSQNPMTGQTDGNLAPVRDGNYVIVKQGTKNVKQYELIMQSAVSQSNGNNPTSLYYDFSMSPSPIYAFGAAIFLAYSTADFADGQVIVDFNDGHQTISVTSDSNNYDPSQQWVGFQTSFPITSIRFTSPTMFSKRATAPTTAVYVSLAQVYFGTTPIIINDPHFIGFQGEHFDFQGESGKWFSIISDDRFQVNALFQHLSYNKEGSTNMVAFGIVADDNTVLVSTNATVVNGKTIKPDSVKELDGVSVSDETDTVTVSTAAWSMTVMRTQTHKNEPFLNLFPVAKDKSHTPHGIMGQTLHHVHKEGQTIKVKGHQGEGEIEGSMEDYIVSSAFATDNVFNKYH